MFTGLVEEKGRIRRIEGNSFIVEAEKVLDGLKIGDSVSLNGVCLTVVQIDSASFKVDVVSRTLRITNLGRLRPGDLVNLERAKRLGERIGGHLLTGHVDGLGRVVRIIKEKNGWSMGFEVGDYLKRYMIVRGSIGVDGVSLTIGGLFKDGFSVFLIPHTLKTTTLGQVQIGYLANIEVDMIAKYVEKMVGREGGGITQEFLKEHGFLK